MSETEPHIGARAERLIGELESELGDSPLATLGSASSTSSKQNSNSRLNVTQEQADWFSDAYDRLVNNVEQAVVGQRSAVGLALLALLSEGHVLLEGLPGTGKTSLSRAIAGTMGASSSRIQFTPDLVPSDVLGITVYNAGEGRFEFHPGPIFASIVLADDFDEASPSTQSALLDVMEEGIVNVDGIDYPVGAPFMVIAARRPPHGESDNSFSMQLDRFLMRISMQYPDHTEMVDLLMDSSGARKGRASQIIDSSAIVIMANLARDVAIDRQMVEYVSRLVGATRAHPHVLLGASVRGALALARTAKTRALAYGRTRVSAEDISTLARPVLAHRLLLQPQSVFAGVTTDDVLSAVIEEVEPPVAGAA